MAALRIIGVVWLSLGLCGACWSLFDLSKSVAQHAFADTIESDIIALAFCLLAAFSGYGALRRKRWARVLCGVASAVLILYAISYISMVGFEFGTAWFAAIFMAAAFAIYSLFALRR